MNSVAKEFHFSDFTRGHYREILRLAKQNFIPRFFHDFRKDEPFILLRHDVDMSVPSALKLAEMEAEEGIHSTFFFHMHNEFYNLLEADIVDIIRKILDFGHQLGLHFDTHFYGIEEEEGLEASLLKEKQLLEDIFRGDIRVFSFHNTTPFTMNCTKHTYAGMINTYADYFQSQVEYCSDTNGYWRFKRLLDVMKDREIRRLHLLTHPVWWTGQEDYPRHKIWRTLAQNAQRVFTRYNDVLKHYGRKNIGELSGEFEFLKSLAPSEGEKLEKDWMEGFYAPVFVAVWSFYERMFNSNPQDSGEHRSWREKSRKILQSGESFSKPILKQGVMFAVDMMKDKHRKEAEQ